MKKIIYSILTLSLVLSGSLSAVSCSSDDSSSTEVNPNPNPNPNPDPNPDPNPNPSEKTLVVTASTTSAYLGDTITLSATLDGVAVTSGVTYYVDDVAISGNTVTSDVATEFLISAKYENITSAYISVAFAVNPFLTIEGEGNFIYNGTSHNVDAAYLVLDGFYSDNNGGATAYWIQYGWSGNNPDTAENFVSVGFDTPATVSGNQVTDYVLPNADQNMIYIIGVVQANGQFILENEGVSPTGVVTVTGDVTYNSLNTEANPVTADFAITALSGSHNLSFTYNGDVSPIQSARAKQLKSGKNFIKPLSQKEANTSDLIKKVLKK